MTMFEPKEVLPIRGLMYGTLLAILLFWAPIGAVAWLIIR